jgi:hypothetical protein
MSERVDNHSRWASENLSLAMQLQSTMKSIHQLDEMFQWLASTSVQRFGVSLAQFWTVQNDARGYSNPGLLAMAGEDPSVPERVVVNEEITRLVNRLAVERRVGFFFPLEQAFSSYQATRLNRYGFHYGAGAFLEKRLLLLRGETAPVHESAPTHFAVATLLFLRQPADLTLLTSISAALEEGILMAADRGFTFFPAAHPFPAAAPRETAAPLAPRSGTPPEPARIPLAPTPPTPPQGEALPPLEELIPYPRSDPDLLLAKNPFSNAAAIADKRARRLYAAIDGHKNVSELCSDAGFSLREGYRALQILLKQQRVEIYTPGGQLINPSRFLKGY